MKKLNKQKIQIRYSNNQDCDKYFGFIVFRLSLPLLNISSYSFSLTSLFSSNTPSGIANGLKIMIKNYTRILYDFFVFPHIFIIPVIYHKSTTLLFLN
jgi:hypothetical protein